MNDTPQTQPAADPTLTATQPVVDPAMPVSAAAVPVPPPTPDDTLQMQVSRRQKEALSASVVTEAATNTATPELGASSQPAEFEAPKELEPEIEKAAERVTQHRVTAPENTVIAADHMPTETPKTVSQPVVILPLSEQEMNSAKRKNQQHSVRWLYQWCVRQIQKLAEVTVLYREPKQDQ